MEVILSLDCSHGYVFNKDELIRSLLDGSYCPNPVCRVEIPKDNGKMHQLGIPVVVERLVQYENEGVSK